MMLNDLRDAVRECSVWVTVKRYSAPEIINGRAKGAPKSAEFRALVSFQPVKSSELALLPEGAQNQGASALFSEVELRTSKTSESNLPDRIVYQDEEWEVSIVEQWRDLGGYWRVVAVRVTR